MESKCRSIQAKPTLIEQDTNAQNCMLSGPYIVHDSSEDLPLPDIATAWYTSLIFAWFRKAYYMPPSYDPTLSDFIYKITAKHAKLILHTNGLLIPCENHIVLEVKGSHRQYGTLQIKCMVDNTSCISMVVAEHVAAVCGWCLQMLEESITRVRLSSQRAYAIYLIEGLTPREKEVLILMATPFSTPKIMDKLSISLGTLRKHQQHIREQLQVCSGREAVQIALDANITDC